MCLCKNNSLHVYVHRVRNRLDYDVHRQIIVNTIKLIADYPVNKLKK